MNKYTLYNIINSEKINFKESEYQQVLNYNPQDYSQELIDKILAVTNRLIDLDMPIFAKLGVHYLNYTLNQDQASLKNTLVQFRTIAFKLGNSEISNNDTKAKAKLVASLLSLIFAKGYIDNFATLSQILVLIDELGINKEDLDIKALSQDIVAQVRNIDETQVSKVVKTLLMLNNS